MFHFLRTHPEHTSRICDAIIDIFKKNLLNERITYPLLNFLSLLISSGTIDSVVLDTNSRFSGELFNLVKLEIKGHKKLYKLVSSISVFCQLIKVSFFLEKSSLLVITITHLFSGASIEFQDFNQFVAILGIDACSRSKMHGDEALRSFDFVW